MSPIFEGTVTSIESAVEIPATSVDGYKLGNKDIQGTTYNKVASKYCKMLLMKREKVTGNVLKSQA